MALLRSRSGRFYEIPDEELSNFEIPAEKLKEALGDMGPEDAEGGVQPYGRRRWVVAQLLAELLAELLAQLLLIETVFVETG